MRVFASLILIPASLLAAASAMAQFADPPSATNPNQPISLYDLFGVKPPGLRGAELDSAVAAASNIPLGTDKNPVRVAGIKGERDYLARLRCSGGRAPKVVGRHTGMPSPFGGVSDVYGVQCGSAATTSIHMDMYHEHVETRAVPGFAIVAP